MEIKIPYSYVHMFTSEHDQQGEKDTIHKPQV